MSTDWYAPNQQAVRRDGSGPAEEGDGGSDPPPVSSTLDGLTKDELLEIAAEQGIDVSSSATKAEIREAIEAG